MHERSINLTFHGIGDSDRRLDPGEHDVPAGLTPVEPAGPLGRTGPSIHGLHHRGRGASRAALSEMECCPVIGQTVAA